MKKKILNIILLGLCSCFILLFILGFISSRSLKSASAEYFPPHDGYGWIIDNSTIDNSNLLNVTGQTLNTSSLGWSYSNRIPSSDYLSLMYAIVECNGNFVLGESNGMLLNYRGDLDNSIFISSTIITNYTGTFRFHLVNKAYDYSKDYFINVTANVPYSFSFSFDLSDYDIYYDGSLYLRGGYYGPPQDSYEGFYALFNGLIISNGSNDNISIVSYSDVNYFGERFGYNEGYNNGYALGFENALDVGEVSAGNFFSRVLDILDVKIFGFVSLGDMFKVLFGVSIVIILLKLFAGG